MHSQLTPLRELTFHNVIAQNDSFRIYHLDQRLYLSIKTSSNSEHFINFLLDSGAMCSAIQEEELERLNVREKVYPLTQNCRLVSANGGNLNILGMIDLPIRIGIKEMHHTFFVGTDCLSNIIGMDAFDKFDIQTIGKTLKIGGKLRQNTECYVNINALKINEIVENNKNSITSNRKTIIRSGRSKRVKCAGNKTRNASRKTNILIDDIIYDNSRIMALHKEVDLPTVCSGLYEIDEYGKIDVFVAKLSPQGITIEDRQILGVFDPLTQPPLEMHKPPEKRHNDPLTTCGKDAPKIIRRDIFRIEN